MKSLFRRSTTRGAAEFQFPNRNWLLVRTAKSGKVTICATADRLTPQQRAAFARYLRAEGFVDAGHASPAGFGECDWNQTDERTHWLVDATWPDVDPTYALHMRKLRLCTLGLFVVWIAGLIVLINF